MMNARPCALAIAVLLMPACSRGTKTQAPAEDASPPAAADAEAGIELRYGGASQVLQQKGHFEMTQAGFGGFSEISFDIENTLELAPSDDGVEVAWSVVDVRDVEAKGSLVADASLRDQVVAQGGGVLVADLRGTVDQEATQARPENQAQAERFKKLEAAAKTDDDRKKLQSLGLVFFSAAAVASLPELPEQPLVEGEPVTVEEEENVSLGGLSVPIESETTYTLVEIDASSGERLAKIKIEGESSGALETPQGFLAVDATREGTLSFNLDRHIPVQLEATESQSFSQGDRSLETTTRLRSTWTRP